MDADHPGNLESFARCFTPTTAFSCTPTLTSFVSASTTKNSKDCANTFGPMAPATSTCAYARSGKRRPDHHVALPNSRTTTNKPHSQHLVGGVVVVGVAVVVDIAIVEVHVDVPRRRRRASPNVVGPAARIAFSLCFATMAKTSSLAVCTARPLRCGTPKAPRKTPATSPIGPFYLPP